MNIFVSYASADRPRVKPLVEALGQQGWSVWWDRSILPGKSWDQVIESALAGAGCVIVLWSRNSISSEWVRAEAGEAHRRGILVPALLDNVEIPLPFNTIQTANLSGWRGSSPDPEFDNLVQAVSATLHDPARPAPAAGTREPARPPWARRIGLSLGLAAVLGTAGLVVRGPGGVHPGTAPEPSPPKPAVADPEPAFDGRWKADVNYGELWEPVNRTNHETFQFSVTGSELVGTASLLGAPRAIRDGKVSGRNISFTTVYELTDGSRGQNRYSGTLSGDRIRFTFQDSEDGGAIPFTAVRVKP